MENKDTQNDTVRQPFLINPEPEEEIFIHNPHVPEPTIRFDTEAASQLKECIENGDIQGTKDLLKNISTNKIDISEETTPKNKTILRLLVENFGYDLSIPKINAKNVPDMSLLFSKTQNNEIDLSNWDVSNVENMMLMFYDSNINLFDAGLKNWDVSKVRNMRWMMEDTSENRKIVQAWKGKGLLNKEINENEIFYAKQKH